MKKRLLIALTALLMPLLGATHLYSAETNAPGANALETTPATQSAIADLKELVARINSKLKDGKNTEADLADNLKEFDALLAKHKDADPEARAKILSMKGGLYMQVLEDPEKALAVFQQLKKDYPKTQIGQNIDDVVTSLQGMIERKKISDGLVPGAPFPDFNENDVEGNPLSISRYKGKVVLVDFWATWCMPCVAKVPELQAAYDKFHDKGFEVVGVSLDVDKGRLQQFTKEKKMPWPEFFDGKRWENKLAVKYGVDATPTGYLLDRNGKILKKLSGDEDLDTTIAQALKK